MSETAAASESQRRAHQRHRAPDARSLDIVGGLRTRLVRTVLVAAAVLALIAGVAGGVALALDSWVWPAVGAAVGAVAVLFVTLNRMNAAANTVNEQVAADRVGRETAERAAWEAYWRAEAVQKALDDVQREVGVGASQVQALIADTVKELGRLAEQIRRGETPVPQAAEFALTGGPYAGLQPALNHVVRSAVGVATLTSSRQPVAVLLTLARRLQPLIHRSIKELDELESQVEDPDLLNALFRLDHLVTRARRQAESIAVLGGATARQIRKPVPVYTVLRQAIAEIEHYGRVKVLRPVHGTVLGHAVTEVIHLVAELVENAAAFSPPDTKVQVQVDMVPDGLSIEIDDLGLLMSSELRQRMNQLLATPDRLDVGEQLKDGRIGLIVVAAIARRYKIRVRLERNERGGNRALVVLPANLLSDATERAAPEPVSAVPEPAGPLPTRTPTGPSPVGGSGGTDLAVATRPVSSPVSSPAASRPVSGPAGPSAIDQPTDATARPALPRRAGQHMTPELLHANSSEGADPGSHNPGLLASYQRGRERADQDPQDPPPATSTDS